jgi:Sel1 repeat
VLVTRWDTCLGRIMKSLRKIIWLVTISLVCLAGMSHAQILYMTVPTLKSSVPAMAVLQLYPGSPRPPQLTTAPRSVALPVRAAPSLDKAELERRVVAFQKQRSEEGFPSAQYELGLRYFTGDGVPIDEPTARKWLRLAADGGSTQAQQKLEKLRATEDPQKL